MAIVAMAFGPLAIGLRLAPLPITNRDFRNHQSPNGFNRESNAAMPQSADRQ
jgi:hypothetical protein